MGRLLLERNLVPDHILTSTANRAIETASLAAKAAKFPGEIESVPALYRAEPPTFVAVVSRVPERLDRKSTRLNSSHITISYAVFCLKKKKCRCQDVR